MKVSKIENEKAINLIRKVYPKADFWYDEDNSRFCIAFGGENTKVYSYCCINTLHFLKRIHIVDDNVMYKKDYNNYLKDLEKQKKELFELENGRGIFFFMTREQAIDKQKKEIERIENIVNSSIVLDI